MEPITLSILGITSYVLAKRKLAQASDSPSDSFVGPIDPFTRWDGFFVRYGALNGVPWRWLKALCMNESSLGTHPSVALGLQDPGNEESVSDDGLSYGLMQETLPTARDYLPGATLRDLNNPDTSVNIASQYVAHLMRVFGSDRRNVVMSYNQGEGNTKKGKDDSAYYDRFVRNLAAILDRQPGNELE